MNFQSFLTSELRHTSPYPIKESQKIETAWNYSATLGKISNKYLLLIDREEDRRHVTQTGLELMTNWTIWVARSYSEGLNFAKTQPFHAILINLDRNPLEILQQLLSHPTTRNIPIILTIDRLRYADKEQFNQLGIAGAIAQPYDCVNLGNQIACFLNWQCDRA